jgi:hypothetical protein
MKQTVLSVRRKGPRIEARFKGRNGGASNWPHLVDHFLACLRAICAVLGKTCEPASDDFSLGCCRACVSVEKRTARRRDVCVATGRSTVSSSGEAQAQAAAYGRLGAAVACVARRRPTDELPRTADVARGRRGCETLPRKAPTPRHCVKTRSKKDRCATTECALWRASNGLRRPDLVASARAHWRVRNVAARGIGILLCDTRDFPQIRRGCETLMRHSSPLGPVTRLAGSVSLAPAFGGLIAPPRTARLGASCQRRALLAAVAPASVTASTYGKEA